MKKFAFVLLALLAVGCKTRPVQPTYSLQTFPAAGTTETIGIGEHMLTQGIASTVDAIVLSNDVSFGDVTVKQGKYALAGENAEYRHFGNVTVTNAGKLSNRGKLYLFKKDVGTKNICTSRNLCVEADYTIGTATTYSPVHKQQTLLYSGKIGNRITLGYREFVNEIARPAFSNDVDYDLSESTTLGYKGARVQVLKATNTEITYKVISGFK